MIYIQKWTNDSFEFTYLQEISKVIKEKPNSNLYIGFDCGFFCGINIYYGSCDGEEIAKNICKLLKKKKLNVRLLTNIDYNFDVIILLGYTNNESERQYLQKNKKKLMKALSFF